jgi:enolase-phosphatase E1
LQRWSAQGLVLAVYSSGSVAAQQLLYGHNQAGDLRNLFSHWFDTRTGPKQAASSYALISAAMDCEPAQILFISDAIAELEAAAKAGLQVLFSDRAGNPERGNGRFEKISDYSQLNLNDALHRA